MLEYHQTPLNQSINPMQVITHITHHPSSIIHRPVTKHINIQLDGTATGFFVTEFHLFQAL